jgi:hypothetical protein
MGNFKNISETTLVPISFVAIIITLTAWIVTIKAAADSLKEKTEIIQKTQDVYFQEIKIIDERLSRIEGMLKKNLRDSDD